MFLQKASLGEATCNFYTGPKLFQNDIKRNRTKQGWEYADEAPLVNTDKCWLDDGWVLEGALYYSLQTLENFPLKKVI